MRISKLPAVRDAPQDPARQSFWQRAKPVSLRLWPLGLGLVILAPLVAVWPGWVLAYGRVFAWPALVGIVALAFKREIGGLFGGLALREAHLPGGSRLVFTETPDRPQPSVDPEHEGWGTFEQALIGEELALDADEAAERGKLEMQLAAAQRINAMLLVFAQLYAVQLDFLIHLRASLPGGLSTLATEEWFRSQIEARPQFAPGFWDAKALIDWLIRNEFIRVQENGNYTLGDMGERVLELIDLNFWYAPKIW